MTELAVDVSGDIREELERTSNELGIDEEELVDRAIIMFLDSIRKEEQLRKEFSEWDEASDEALEETLKNL